MLINIVFLNSAIVACNSVYNEMSARMFLCKLNCSPSMFSITMCKVCLKKCFQGERQTEEFCINVYLIDATYAQVLDNE